jgi:hypothetical protein
MSELTRPIETKNTSRGIDKNRSGSRISAIGHRCKSKLAAVLLLLGACAEGWNSPVLEYRTDGQGGEEPVCEPGTVISCYSGPEGTEDVGECRTGITICNEEGFYEPCQLEITPKPERCDATYSDADENCDGQFNEGGEGCICVPETTIVCYTGLQGTEGEGLCKPGYAVCHESGMTYSACMEEVTPEPEQCEPNGFEDEDCDGQTNEGGAGCACVPGELIECYTGPASTKGIGDCHAGTKACKPDGTGFESFCVGQVTPLPETQTCLINNAGDDSDCDGKPNELCCNPPCTSTQQCKSNFPNGWICLPSQPLTVPYVEIVEGKNGFLTVQPVF